MVTDREADARILVIGPAADLYGSDLQVLESVLGLISHGYSVTYLAPSRGPLLALIEEAGGATRVHDFPVLRRSNPEGRIAVLLRAMTAMPRMIRIISAERPRVIYVNTLTLPWWLAAARISRVPSLCHVHEAERHEGAFVRAFLYFPLVLANVVLVISREASLAASQTVPVLTRKLRLVPNGVPARPDAPRPREFTSGRFRVGSVARLSPRKGTADAVEAVAMLVGMGLDVELHLFGDHADGYEDYRDQLVERAAEPDLEGRVHFHGHVRPVWEAHDEMHCFVAASHIEPYGNSVVEAQYSALPVIATRTGGHLETVRDGETGRLVEVGDVQGLANALREYMLDYRSAASLGERARAESVRRNSVERYRNDIAGFVQALASLKHRGK